jgi:phage gp29-like protein
VPRLSLIGRLAALLGISAYALPRSGDVSLDDESVERLRAQNGGQLQPMAPARTRWLHADLEVAEHLAESGDLSLAGQLSATMQRDGVLAGVLSTRTDGLVQLPQRWRGPQDMVDALQRGGEAARSVFNEMFPPTELAKLAADGVKLGVGVGELVPVLGRDFPVFVRLDPQFLVYRWTENRWYFRSIAGLIPITPGDGRWILHLPGGRTSPWQGGAWRPLGRAYITKDHARERRDNWEGKLANPARVAVAPQGASEAHKQSWFRKVMAWGVNTVFGLTPGYDVKLLESNGRGYESFQKTIAEQNGEITICIAGQTVTTDGGAGFQNSDIHKSIRADLIKSTADALAHTLNTQGLPPWVIQMFGENRLAECPTIEWDVTPPKDRNAEATALVQCANAILQLVTAMQAATAAGIPVSGQLDVDAVCTRFGVPLKAAAANDQQPAKPQLAVVKEAA